MNIKKIIGERIYLSPSFFSEENAKLFTSWVNDPKVFPGIGSTLQINIEREKDFLKNLSKDESEHSFIICLKENDKAIGIISLANIDHINKICELGIFIGEQSYSGKGIGYESCNLILDYGFNILNINNIYLNVYSYNKRAISLYKKLGFKHAGTIREAKWMFGKKNDKYIYDMLLSEFQNSTLKKSLKDIYDID